jgi:hypothetical protein
MNSIYSSGVELHTRQGHFFTSSAAKYFEFVKIEENVMKRCLSATFVCLAPITRMSDSLAGSSEGRQSFHHQVLRLG